MRGARLMMIDAHVHLGLPEHCIRNDGDFANLYCSYPDLLKEMDKANVSRAIVFPIPHLDFDVRKSNEYVLEAATKSNGRLIPFCRIDEHLRRNLQNGFKGVKLHQGGMRGGKQKYEGIETKNIVAELRIIEDFNAPLILHAPFEGKPAAVKEILSIAPNLFLILAHCGRGHVHTAEQVLDNARTLKKYDRVYFETSTIENPLTDDAGIIKHVCDILGNNRVLFGTDYPFKRELGYKCHIDHIQRCPIDALTLQKITADNVVRLLNLENNQNRAIIRRTNKNDIPLLFDGLFNELTKQDKKYLAFTPKMKYRNHWENHIEKGNSCFVVVIQEKIVGYMRVFAEFKNDHKGDLWDFVVHPDYRRRGIAKEMFAYLHRRFPEMFTKTDAKNIPMQALLRKFGYNPDNPEAQRVIKWTHVVR